MTEPKWYDITISREIVPTMEQVIDTFEKIGCERYVIGEEIGKGGFLHWQTRIVLEKGRTFEQMKEIFKTCGHVTPSQTRNFAYCEKEGRFYRSWEKSLNKYASLEMWPWQQEILDILKDQNERQITVVIDENGSNGKSYLRKHLQVTHQCEYIPPMKDWKDIMRICMAKPGKGYCFDLPRNEKASTMDGLWSAIESVKDGYLFDDRYSFQEKWIETPKILVFTNTEPPYGALSPDRWDCWDIVKYGPIPTVRQHEFFPDRY